MTRGQGAIRIAVGGGKGGTGKSSVALNLAVSIARLGMRTVIVDVDLGAANLHTMLGIDRAGPTLQALIDKKITSLEEASVPTPEPRLFLVPGVGAVVGGANPSHTQKTKVLRHIQSLDADVIVVDVGAGMSFNNLDFFELGDARLVVTTPQVTSVHNAYAFVKGAVHRALGSAASPADRALLSKASDGSLTTERIADVLTRVAGQSPALAARCRQVLAGFGASIVANQVDSAPSHNVAHGLSRMVRDFLALDAPVIAQLPMSPALHRSVGKRMPITITSPSDPISRAFLTLAERMISVDVATLRAARASAAPAVAELDAAMSDAAEPALPVLDGYVRREDRTPVDLPARVRADGGEWRVVRLVDISPHGACVLAGELAVRPGQMVEIRVERPMAVALRGEVRHTQAGRVGLELDAECVARSRELIETATGVPLAARAV